MNPADCWDDAPDDLPIAVRREDPRPLSEVIPGHQIQTEAGPCYRVRHEYPVNYHYGGQPLERARLVSGVSLAVLARDDDFQGLSLDQACFIDTETTGLAGGTGTYVFMVGLGYFAGDFFRIDQFFMEDYDEDPALVAVLAGALDPFEAVVSFNGKAFDLPLIDTRFILSRRRPPLAGRPHLDLLAPSRRLWGLRLESCRLVALEEAILGETRVGDVPGALVPDLYFRFLRTRDPWYVKPIFDHNRQDVLSLLSLAGRAVDRYEAFLCPGSGGDAAAGDGGSAVADEAVHPLDLYSLSRLYRAAGKPEPAIRCLLACLEAGGTALPAGLIERAGLECVRLLRRLGRGDEAGSLCERLADGYPQRPWALVELAKDLEHRRRDYERALAVVDRAIGLADSGRREAAEEFVAALLWRRNRIARKHAARASRSRSSASHPPSSSAEPDRHRGA